MPWTPSQQSRAIIEPCSMGGAENSPALTSCPSEGEWRAHSDTLSAESQPSPAIQLPLMIAVHSYRPKTVGVELPLGRSFSRRAAAQRSSCFPRVQWRRHRRAYPERVPHKAHPAISFEGESLHELIVMCCRCAPIIPRAQHHIRSGSKSCE